MSLRLRQAVAGRPNVRARQCIGSVNVDGRKNIAYPSCDNVLLVDTELELVETLAFWSALPYHSSSSTSTTLSPSVEGVACSPENLIIAWSGIHIVIWQRLPAKGKATSQWAVHSTLVASAEITCLDLRSGLLAIGTEIGIEIWRMDPKAEVVVWDRLWERSYLPPTVIAIAPSASNIAWFTEGQKCVQIHTLNSKGEMSGTLQELRHPRQLESICWRNLRSSNGDAHLYTTTIDCVLRIYSPVLDDPTWFQLLYSLDSRPFSQSLDAQASIKGKQSLSSLGRFWILDREIVKSEAQCELSGLDKGQIQISADVKRALETLRGEESDVVGWISPNGEIALRCITNMDRKPPTLLKTSPLACPQTFGMSIASWSPSAFLLHTNLPTNKLHLVLPPTTNQPLSMQPISIVSLLSPPLDQSTQDDLPQRTKGSLVQMSDPIDHFVRTPNGRGLLAVGTGGEIGAWEKMQLGKEKRSNPTTDKPLLGRGNWTSERPPKQSAIFAKGRAIVFYSRAADGKAFITLQHLDPSETHPSPPVTLPHFTPDSDDEVEMLLAVSDVDDGISGRGRRTQRAFIMAATRRGETWIWRVASQFDATNPTEINPIPEISLLSHYRLPVHSPDKVSGPHLILPVDPMGWHQSVIDWQTDTPLQDMVLTVSSEGVLEFWQPRLGQHLVGRNTVENVKNGDAECRHDDHEKGKDMPWIRSGVVHTGKSNILFARCSSRKKTAIVSGLPDGSHEMTIWDSNISEFSTGLELTHVFPHGDMIQDLDWTTTSDLQSVLAVGFSHKVVLVCEQRMSYIDISPGWAPFLTIDMEKYTSVPINDSIWLAGGSLAVGVGNQIYLFSRFLTTPTPGPSPSASVKSLSMSPEEPEDIFQLIAHQNGPLWDFHPTMLFQCLLWNKADLVKSILVSLVKSLKDGEKAGKKYVKLPRLEPMDFYCKKKVERSYKPAVHEYESLFDTSPAAHPEDEEEFSDRLVGDLVDRLDGPVILPLTYSEKSALATVAQATLEAEQQRRSLDLTGLRYLISLRMFVNQHRRMGGGENCNTPSASATHGEGHVLVHQHRNRLAFRNIVWALHSESPEVLLSAATECCSNGKMLWDDAKRLGVFLWLSSHESLRSQLEVIARNRFMQDEDRDPTSCSLIFFALGKKKIVHGLWRQAPGHKEQQMMLKFLANDFELPRWKTAALKNAYALLSKQRYEYAAAFFMLAGSPKDALNVCLRQMDDWQLAIALARVVEGGTQGPLVRWILTDHVIPTAFAGGHRWLASWAFWCFGRRDLAVRVLISPMSDVLKAYAPVASLTVGDPENDDPSLLLLFQHLKSRTLQTAKGTSEISAKLEFDFVLHNARVFFRMGCHPLALDLLRSWSFERPVFVTVPRPTKTQSATPDSLKTPSRPSLVSVSPSYARNRRTSFMLASGHGRRESMLMDMDVLAESGSSTRVPSPSTPIEGKEKDVNGHAELKDAAATVKDASAAPESMPKIGNLMKELKQDVKQGAMEFDMDSFF